MELLNIKSGTGTGLQMDCLLLQMGFPLQMDDRRAGKRMDVPGEIAVRYCPVERKQKKEKVLSESYHTEHFLHLDQRRYRIVRVFLIEQ